MEQTTNCFPKFPLIALCALALASSAFAAPPPAVEAPNAPQHLRCEYLKNPRDIDVLRPRFAWWLTSSRRGESPIAYQILVSTSREALAQDRGELWDSGKVASPQSTQIAYAGRPLQSGAAYYWKVRWWNQQGKASPYSKPARFEMGLLHRDEWHGEWIGGANLLRKPFTIPGAIRRARVYVAALGYYQLRINGRKIGRNVLDPAWTTYPKRVLYRAYDVTPALHEGKNVIGAVLGGGWAMQVAGGIPGYYTAPALLLQMNVTLADGRQIGIATDTSWQTHAGPILRDSVYNGEIFDARLEQPGWDRPGFDPSGWQPARRMPGSAGKLSAEMMPPIRAVDTLVPRSMSNPRPGVYVYDFGQNISGWVRLRVRGPRGTRVEMRYAELLYPDGMLNRENLRGAKARDVYILKGRGLETFQPIFTYHGFRYVELTGYPGTPSLDTLRARFVHTAVSPSGSFVASNELLNRIQSLIHWSQLSNLMSIPTDCDQRNERQGWMGDAQLSAKEAMLNFDMAAFYTNFIRDIRDAQKPDGEIPDTVPHKYGSYPADPAWGTAYPILCWYMWQQYGDRRILRQNYASLQKYEAYLESRAQNNVLRYSYYGDWVAIDPTPGALVSDFYYDYDTRIMASIARVLGHSDEAGDYTRLASEIRAGFNRTFFDAKTGQYATGSQTADALALFLHLPPKGHTGQVISHLVNDVVYRHNTHLTTGIVGTRFLLPVLTEYGNNDVAYELATQTTFPSWGYMVRRGATTLWELWQDKTGPSMNSHDHIMFGSIGAWFYNALGGIRLAPESQGYRRIVFAPQIVENLHWVSASLDTVRGVVSCSWKHGLGKIEMRVTVPVGSAASVSVPQEDQMTHVTIRESGRVVWENGHFVPGDSGVQAGKREGNRYEFTVASGSYDFQLTGD